MTTVSLSLDEIFELAKKTLLANGCDDDTANKFRLSLKKLYPLFLFTIFAQTKKF